jgi:hypothetical protein
MVFRIALLVMLKDYAKKWQLVNSGAIRVFPILITQVKEDLCVGDLNFRRAEQEHLG